ncbi:MAG: sulfotransferase [Pirellulaceae bacterium]
MSVSAADRSWDRTANRQCVVVLSTMRSGSTLLKALLGEAPDVSNLNEINFQRFANPGFRDWESVWNLAPERILLLKRPGWYNEIGSYPRVPSTTGDSGDRPRAIVLVRDVYDTVESLRKMSFGRIQKWASPFVDRWLAIQYWVGITRSILSYCEVHSKTSQLARYEDLVQDPLSVTQRLFEFIGSEQQEGVDTYSQPDSNRWRWGRDDNSPNIRSLKVQSPKDRPKTNKRLLATIESDPRINELRKQLGYC